MKLFKSLLLIFFITVLNLNAENYTIKWGKTIEIGSGDAAEGITYDTTGYIYVTGYANFNTSNNILTLKYDSLGNLLKIDTLNIGVDYAYDITSDNDGNYFIAGYTKTGSNYDFLLAKYNPYDSLLWSRTFDNGENDYAFAVATDKHNYVYIAGHSTFGSQNLAIIIEYDTDGNILWSDTLFYSYGSNENTNDIAIDTADNIYLTGKTTYTTEAIWTLKYDSLKNIVWQDTIDKGYNGRGIGITLGNNNVYMVSYVYNGSNNDILTTKYDTAGNIIWENIIDNGDEDYASSIVTDRFGYIYIGGYSMINGDYDFLIVKYNYTGNIIWADTFDYGGNDYLHDIDVDTYGNIYVAGNNSSNGFITIMYENQQGIVSNDRTIDNNDVKIKQTGKGKINISFTPAPQNDYSISIYNLTGSLIKKIRTTEINNGNITVNNLTPGIYMLRYKVSSFERKNKFVILP